VRFRVLGPVSVSGDVLAASRERTVLAVLLLEPNHLVPVERLIDAVWGDNPPVTARAQIHTGISRLRRELGPAAGAVSTDPAGYRIAVSPDDLDTLVFAAHVDAARTAIAEGRLAHARQDLRAALELWRGPAFTGITGPIVESAAARLEEQRFAAWEDRVDLDLRLGPERELVGELTDLVRRYPLRERLRGQLMLALYRVGRQADALAVYREGRERLADELGLDPGPDLEELHKRILTRDPALSATPAPATLTERSDAARCLPRDIADFTGRESAIERVLSATVHDPGVTPVLAIDGMAGMGKTALAVHVGHRLAARYADAQLFVDLHGHSEQAPLDPAAALSMLLRQVGVAPSRVPETLDERIALWRTELADRRALVVLDNAADATQVAPLLPNGPRCLTLVTSRRRLIGLDGALPVSLEVLPPDEAVALLARVVGDRVAAEPAAAAEVVRLCGNLPLAIRLAAARLAHRPKWSVADLAARLRAADPPLAQLAADGRSVAAAFTLSYRHVSEPAQHLFRLLGLHPGADFDAHVSAALADVPVDVAEDLLEDLVDAHLLEAPAAGRYRFHDLLRDYARLLVSTEPDDVRKGATLGMLDYYLHTTVGATEHMEQAFTRSGIDFGGPSRNQRTFPRSVEADEWLDVEWQNGVAAVHGALGLREHRHAWQLSRALWPYLWRGHPDVLISTLTKGLAAANALHDEAAAATIHNYLASGWWQQGRLTQSLEHLQQALAIREQLGDDIGRIVVLANLGMVSYWLGRFDEAGVRARQSVALGERLESPAYSTRTMNLLGAVAMRLGDFHRSLRWHREALALSNAASDRYERALSLGEIGAVHRLMGHHRLAILLLTHAQAEKRETNNRHGEAETLSELACAYRDAGQIEQALAWHARAVAVVEQFGNIIAASMVHNDLAATLLTTNDCDQAVLLFQRALAEAEHAENRYEQARAHVGIGRAVAARDPDRARRHWVRAMELFEKGMPERNQVARQLESVVTTTELVDSVGQDRAENGQAVLRTAGRSREVNDQRPPGDPRQTA
jgi:DNA-binding SARP family transcriptional activator/Tfp pilus assembly protein PilF